MDSECAFECRVESLEPQPALTIRLKTRPEDIAEMFDRGFSAIDQYLEAKGKKPTGPPFVIYINMEMDNLEIEFGFPVEEGIEGESPIQATMTPSGEAVTSLYIGPYEEAEPVYDALLKWVSDNNVNATGVAYEVYLNNPAETPPEQLKIQVYLMLA